MTDYKCLLGVSLKKDWDEQAKLDAKRSKREDSIPEQAKKEFRQFLDETFDRRMEIVEQLQKERDDDRAEMD